MASAQDVADDIKTTISSWADANDLDQTLENLHEIPRAVQEAFSQFADRLREDTQLAERIPESISEAASSMNGIADQLQSDIRFGVQRS